jgi:hypothetical protein
MANIDPKVQESNDWIVRDGELDTGAGQRQFVSDHEALTYNNPFKQSVERVWFDGKIVYAVDCGEVEGGSDKLKVAEEYAVVYGMKPDGTPTEEVKGQYNIYDSVPGMKKYSPLWRFNYVIVPKDYKANTLRSEQDVLKSGYEVRRSKKIEN